MSAQFTVILGEIIDNNINIFREYPIFDESYRPILQKKITDYYRYREIGSETIGRFIHLLNAKLNLIMPYYNKYYMAQNLEQRILDNYDVTEEYNRNVSNTGVVDKDTTQSDTATTESTGSNTILNNSGRINKFADSPQSRVNLSEATFLTNLTDENITENNSNNSTTNVSNNNDTTINDTINSTDNSTEH
jgi:hypothetical protein